MKNEILIKFIKYVIPTTIAFIFTCSAEIINGIVAGKYIDNSALSVISLISPISIFINAISIMMCSGSVAIAGEYIGKGEKERANDIFTKTYIILFIISIFLTIVSLLFLEKILDIFNITNELREYGKIYLKMSSYMIIFKTTDMFFTIFFRLMGKPNYVFFFSLSANLIQFIFDIIFVVYLKMGIFGIILASFIGYLAIDIFFIISLVTDKKSIPRFTKQITSFKEIFKAMYNGVSDFTTTISVATVITVFNKVIIQFLGNDGIAAFSVSDYVIVISMYLCFGVADSMSPLISINYGKRDFETIKKILKYGTITSFIFNMIIFLVSSINPLFIVHSFIQKDSSIIPLSVSILKIVKYRFFFNNYNILISSFFTATQKAFDSLLVSLFKSIIFPLSSLYILKHFFGFNGVLISCILPEILTFIFAISLLTINKNKYFTYNKN